MKKFIKSLAIAFLLTPAGLALAQFVIPQGPLTVTAIEAVYIKDLDLNLSIAEVQDMGALYTQKQVNESWDLKHALEHNKVSFSTTGTVPGSSSVTIGPVVASAFVIDQGPLLITNLSATESVYIRDLKLELLPSGTQDMGELYTQNQINTSNDLKSAIIGGKVIQGAGTETPVADPVVFLGGIPTSTQTAANTEQLLQVAEDTSTLKVELDAIYVTTGTFGPVAFQLNASTIALDSRVTAIEQDDWVTSDKILDGAVTTDKVVDAYVFNTGDTMTGNLTLDTDVKLKIEDQGGTALNIVQLGASDQLVLGHTSNAFFKLDTDGIGGILNIDSTDAEFKVGLNMLDNPIVDVSSATVNGSLDVGGRINGVLDFGAVTTAELQTTLLCPAKPCTAYNTDLDDIYTSTGTLAGQWRNSRTGAGP